MLEIHEQTIFSEKDRALDIYTVFILVTNGAHSWNPGLILPYQETPWPCSPRFATDDTRNWKLTRSSSVYHTLQLIISFRHIFMSSSYFPTRPKTVLCNY